MKTRISQREARRLRKRVDELENLEELRLRRWVTNWPMGVNIASEKYEASSLVPVAIRTARALRHAVVATCDVDGNVLFHACRLVKD